MLRGVEIDPICLWCGDAVETIDHILLRCPEACRVWYGSALRFDQNMLNGGTFRDFLWSALNHYPADYVSLIVYNAWELWKSRNELCFEGKKATVHGIIGKAYSQFLEALTTKREVLDNTSNKAQQTVWKPPNPGQKKLNCDVAVKVGGKIGYGFTLRDDYGRILLVSTRGSSTFLEGMAMRYAMRMVRQYGLNTDIVESDSRLLVDGINNKNITEVYCDVIIEDIKALAREIQCTSFAWIPRQCNQTAHHAAKGPEFISINHNPSHLRCFIEEDVQS